MGRQICLRVNETDLQMLQWETLAREGAFVPFQAPTSGTSATNSIQSALGGGTRLWIVKASEVGDVVWRAVEGQPSRTVDQFRSRVVQLSLRPISEVGVRDGRLLFLTARQRTTGASDTTEADFDRWATSLFGWVRRMFEYDSLSRCYVAPSAAASLAEGP